jgi:hypothetical protein
MKMAIMKKDQPAGGLVPPEAGKSRDKITPKP